MGAGKSTVGRRVAELIARPFVDLDGLIESRHGSIAELFRRSEREFRRLEEDLLAEVLAGPDAVIALGGGAVLSPLNRERLAARAFTVHLEVDVDTAWERVGGSDRPLAKGREEFGKLYAAREVMYELARDAVAWDLEGVLLASLAVSAGPLGDLLPAGATALVADERVLELHGTAIRAASVHPVPAGEQAKNLDVAEGLWNELDLSRDDTIVAFGGGSTTDLAGFIAATYLRGIRWIAVPTTLVGQVDAAIGGKTGINLPNGKNLLGAFHFPEQVVIDLAFLKTLPPVERLAGMAEVVKTGLLAGREVWKLPEEKMIRACAAYKCAVVLSDPYEREGRRAVLNLGHTFAHALEAGSGYSLRHGDAVALGLLAALRLSGQPTDVVEDVLRPQPAAADPEIAWSALKRDKKGEGVFVLLEGPGRPVVTTVPDKDARAALSALIRQ
jgi:3-dehydroquinate synthetase/shikimate kinase